MKWMPWLLGLPVALMLVAACMLHADSTSWGEPAWLDIMQASSLALYFAR